MDVLEAQPRAAAAGQEGLIELYGSFQEMFEFFCKNSTIHGTVRLVCSGSNRMKTAFWTLLLLASLAMLYWQFALMCSQFWAYPVVLTMSMHSEHKMFPAVTVCNLDPYRFELVSEHLAQLDRMAEESITFLYGINTSARLFHLKDRKIHVQALANLSSSGFKLSQNFSLLRMSHLRSGKKHSSVGFRLCNSTGGNCFFKAYSSGMDAVLEWYRFHYMNIMAQLPLVINISQHEEHFEDVIYSCQYDGEPCRPSDYIHFHHPVFGSCYTFNSEGTDPFWTATKPGIPYGLSLILRAEQKDHLPLLSTVAGVRVMIHNHNQTPFLEHEGFDIRPGIATTVGIRQDEVNRLGGNYGKCTRAGEDVAVQLLYNSSYTLQACLHSCFQHRMLRECGCGYLYYPLPPGAPRCDYNKHPAWGHCFYRLYSRLRRHHLSCFQQCPKPCRESLYKVSAGTAKWPSAKSQDWVRQALRHQNGYNSSSSRRDIAKVTIFYQQLNSQAVHEAPLLSENLLLSSMGSQWSLWFGSSVLSVVEMLELLLDALALSLLLLCRRLRGTGSAGGAGGTPGRAREHRERPRELQERPRELQERPQEHRERPREHRERPQEHRERPQEHRERPRELQERPREHRERPQELQERPREHRERPQELQERPREHRERPQELQERPREHWERSQELREGTGGSPGQQSPREHRERSGGSPGETVERPREHRESPGTLGEPPGAPGEPPGAPGEPPGAPGEPAVPRGAAGSVWERPAAGFGTGGSG